MVPGQSESLVALGCFQNRPVAVDASHRRQRMDLQLQLVQSGWAVERPPAQSRRRNQRVLSSRKRRCLLCFVAAASIFPQPERSSQCAFNLLQLNLALIIPGLLVAGLLHNDGRLLLSLRLLALLLEDFRFRRLTLRHATAGLDATRSRQVVMAVSWAHSTLLVDNVLLNELLDPLVELLIDVLQRLHSPRERVGLTWPNLQVLELLELQRPRVSFLESSLDFEDSGLEALVGRHQLGVPAQAVEGSLLLPAYRLFPVGEYSVCCQGLSVLLKLN